MHEAAVALAGVKLVTVADRQHGFNPILWLDSKRKSYRNAVTLTF